MVLCLVSIISLLSQLLLKTRNVWTAVKKDESGHIYRIEDY